MIRAGLMVGMFMAVACGGDVVEANQAACGSYRDHMVSLECGGEQLQAQFPEDYCAAYDEALCDMTPYFECLEANSGCDESGQYYSANVEQCEAEANCVSA